jgi:hypothetical protein
MKVFERFRHFTFAVAVGAFLHTASHEAAHFAHEVFVALGAELAVEAGAKAVAKAAEVSIVHE